MNEGLLACLEPVTRRHSHLAEGIASKVELTRLLDRMWEAWGRTDVNPFKIVGRNSVGFPDRPYRDPFRPNWLIATLSPGLPEFGNGSAPAQWVRLSLDNSRRSHYTDPANSSRQGAAAMTATDDRDIEKGYPISEFVAKLRRLADCLETGENF